MGKSRRSPLRVVELRLPREGGVGEGNASSCCRGGPAPERCSRSSPAGCRSTAAGGAAHRSAARTGPSSGNPEPTQPSAGEPHSDTFSSSINALTFDNFFFICCIKVFQNKSHFRSYILSCFFGSPTDTSVRLISSANIAYRNYYAPRYRYRSNSSLVRFENICRVEDLYLHDTQSLMGQIWIFLFQRILQ